MEKGFFYNKKTGQAFRCARTGNGCSGLSGWMIITPGEPCITLEEFIVKNSSLERSDIVLLTLEGEMAPAEETAKWLCCYCVDGYDYADEEAYRMIELGLDIKSRPLSLSILVWENPDFLSGDPNTLTYSIGVFAGPDNVIYENKTGHSRSCILDEIKTLVSILQGVGGFEIRKKELNADKSFVKLLSRKDKFLFTSISCR